MRLHHSRALESVANLAAIIVCAVVVVSLPWQHLQHALRPNRPNLRNSVLEVGSRFPELPGYLYSDKLTIAVFLNSRCTACKESRSDYEILRQAASDSNGRVQFVGVFSSAESPKSVAGFDSHLPSVRVKYFEAYKVSGTPTMVVIDGNGTLRDFWIGRLPPNARGRLLSLVREDHNAN